MKNLTKNLLALLLAALLLCSCGRQTDTDLLWKDALYTADTALGSGAVSLQVEVKAGEKAVTFTVKTDASTLGDALLNLGLIAGDPGEYGLYVKTVNGILADYDTDRSYWSVSRDGELLMTGVDAEPVSDGARYAFVYTLG